MVRILLKNCFTKGPTQNSCERCSAKSRKGRQKSYNLVRREIGELELEETRASRRWECSVCQKREGAALFLCGAAQSTAANSTCWCEGESSVRNRVEADSRMSARREEWSFL